jgi:PAS domain S-box-containing protein
MISDDQTTGPGTRRPEEGRLRYHGGAQERAGAARGPHSAGAVEPALASPSLWRQAFDALDQPACLLDARGAVLRFNPALSGLLGSASATPARQELEGLLQRLRRWCALDRPGTHEPDFRGRWLRVGVGPILDEQGAVHASLLHFSDVTDRKEVEERLRQAQQLGALARLTAGLSHDLNNLLTAVVGNAALLLASAPAASPQRTLLVAMEQASWRAVELCRQVFDASRGGWKGFQSVELADVVRAVVRLLRQVIGPNVALGVYTAPDLWPVHADAGQLERALLNLGLNARDAMPRGGQLFLGASNCVVDEAAARAHPEARPGEFVCLAVRDTGHGIAPEVREHIFKAFFTTKEPDKGTGLGLAVVLDVVRHHGGWVTFSTETGRGTCFEIYLPRTSPGVRC